MKYHQLRVEERFLIGAMRSQGVPLADIARVLERHRTTIWREVRRNSSPYDGGYRSARAHERTGARRKRSRRNLRFGRAEIGRVEGLLRQEWSPEQVAGHLCRTGELSISHETIYRHVWRDLRQGGTLHQHLRCARKRYGRYDNRGRLAGKRMIGERPASVEKRCRIGDWEIDTMMGQSLGESSDCILTLVERKTGYVLIGKLKARTVEQASQAILALMRRHPGKFQTITSDNGTEFHGYRQIEAASPVRFYFATPHHSWERGTNENTNGLIRQYLPKGEAMTKLTQSECDAIAEHLNNRPRKRHGYKTPHQCFHHT